MVSLLAVLVALIAAVSLTLAQDDRPQVRAMIIATDLKITIEELEPSVSAVSDFGDVARAAVDDNGLSIDPDELRTDHVSVDVIESTPVIHVVARDDDPELAVAYANAMAEALAVQLTATEGLGTFAVINEARLQLVEKPANVPVLALSVLAGILTELFGSIALLLWLRPMYTIDELSRVSSAPQVVAINDSPDDIAELAELLHGIDSGWLLIDAYTYRSSQLAADLEKSVGGLRVSVLGRAKTPVAARNSTFLHAALIVAPGVSQSLVRHNEALIGDKLGATIMIAKARRPGKRVGGPRGVDQMLRRPPS